MRIVVLSLFDPWAQTDGGTLRTRAFLTGMSELGHEVVAVHPVAGDRPHEGDWLRVPLSAPPLGERRVPGQLRRLKRYLLPMPTTAGARSTAVVRTLQDVGDADLILISQLSAAQYADVLTSGGLWLDHSDLWSEFARRVALRRRGPGRFTALRQARWLAEEELRHSSRAVFVTAAGVTDAALLDGRLDRDVRWLPTPVAAAGTVVPRDPDVQRTAGFIGNFSFGPNLDALDVLREEWGPQLRDRGWQVVVAGLASDDLVVPPWIRRLGPVRSTREFYAQIDVALAPIRIGGGMKVKVVEALLHGRPVLATPFAMEGFPGVVRDLVRLADADGALPTDDVLLRPPHEANGALQPFTTDGFLDSLRELLTA